MKKNKPIIKGIAIGIVFLFVGIIIIQSTGSSNQKQSTSWPIDPNDFLPPELWLNETQNSYLKNTIDNNEIDNDFTDSTINVFLDRVIHRYPLFKHMGKEMGLTKQGVSDTIKNVGDDNTINTYISFFSKILGL